MILSTFASRSASTFASIGVPDPGSMHIHFALDDLLPHLAGRSAAWGRVFQVIVVLLAALTGFAGLVAIAVPASADGPPSC